MRRSILSWAAIASTTILITTAVTAAPATIAVLAPRDAGNLAIKVTAEDANMSKVASVAKAPIKKIGNKDYFTLTVRNPAKVFGVCVDLGAFSSKWKFKGFGSRPRTTSACLLLSELDEGNGVYFWPSSQALVQK